MKRIAKSDIHIYIYKLTAVFVLCLLVAGLGSCSADSEGVEADLTGSTEPIIFAAQAASQIATRAGEEDSDESAKGKYVDEGPITTGLFCLGYYNTSSAFCVADVDFDKEGLVGTGVGLVWTADNYKELSWSEVKNSSPTTFYMDNVLKKYHKDWKDDHSKGEHDSEIIFKYKSDGTPEHPFVAGLFDYVDGTNDLLWGTKVISRNTNPIVMDLHHYMAIVRVEVTVDKTYQDAKGEIDLCTANVSISNLVHEPYSFNRLDGSVTIAENAERKTLDMVNTKKETGSDLDWVSSEKEKEETVTDDDNNPTTNIIDVYTTKDFVLPPQELSRDDNRPQLRIETKDGRVFSGYIPNAMRKVVNGVVSDTLELLKFRSEYKLTIRTRITQDPPNLIFLPVTVDDWVCKGTFTTTGYQNGVYNEKDFMALIDTYENYNTTNLSRYGYLDNGVWHFNIYRTLTLKYEDIQNKMTRTENDGKADFTFSISRNIYIEKDNKKYLLSPTSNGSTELKTIVTTNTWTPQEDSNDTEQD